MFGFGEIRQEFRKKSGAKGSSEANIRIRARIFSLYQSLAKTLPRCMSSCSRFRSLQTGLPFLRISQGDCEVCAEWGEFLIV